MRGEILTESEKRRIDKIYEGHIKECKKRFREKLRTKSIRRCIVVIVFLLVIYSFLWVGIGLSGETVTLEGAAIIVGLLSLFILPALAQLLVCSKSGGWWCIGTIAPENVVYALKMEAYFTKKYLEYLPMKVRLDGNEFKRYVNHNVPSGLTLNEKNMNKLTEIFITVKERINDIRISDECKVDLTPWEFFRNYIFYWGIYNWAIMDNPSYARGEGKLVYKIMFGIFQELDKAPRISGDLMIKLEDFLVYECKNKRDSEDIFPVSKEEVMKLAEAWRKYKTEERLV